MSDYPHPAESMRQLSAMYYNICTMMTRQLVPANVEKWRLSTVLWKANITSPTQISYIAIKRDLAASTAHDRIKITNGAGCFCNACMWHGPIQCSHDYDIFSVSTEHFTVNYMYHFLRCTAPYYNSSRDIMNVEIPVVDNEYQFRAERIIEKYETMHDRLVGLYNARFSAQ